MTDECSAMQIKTGPTGTSPRVPLIPIVREIRAEVERDRRETDLTGVGRADRT